MSVNKFLLILLSIGLKTIFVFGQQPTVSKITFKNAKKNDPVFLKKIIETKEGKVLDSVQLAHDIRILERLASVASAEYEVLATGQNTEVVYNLIENFTLIPSANVYTTNNDEFAFRAGVKEFNLFRRNIQFGGFFQRDIFNSFNIGVQAPSLFRHNLGLSLIYQDLSTLEPVFLDTGDADYKYNNVSLEALALYQLNFLHRIEIGGSIFQENYTYQSGAVDPNVPQELKVDKHLLKLVYEYSNLDFEYFYVSGFKSILNFQYVGSSNATLPDFLIGWNDFLFYKRLGLKGNWASRIRAGLATNADSPFAPFAVDNNLNIRGVGNTIDRGTGVIVINTEYRRTIFEKKWFVLQSNIFVDAGSWRNPGGDLSDFGDDQNFRVYPGIGLRFMHKRVFNAIFRIDYGYGVTKNATRGLVLGIGQYF
ncbi:outer membrane protein assembly factor [Aquimarina sp. ERC-38]|uniref:outer membrane protein assembly factor n=1 Tax=Aquimarina sp. ERC-38 TaxID=2949996 RepID=UPI00224662FC|nr:outer membrane protein assembly factor [Aquimarina sp. ERC-38]UZO81474.1 outer membrane protein assembly factor [Aquimarina sp. ERC-38]